jgi:hypothetical protein
MKRIFVQQKPFSRELDSLINAKKLLKSDYEDLESELLKNPKMGTVIPGLEGIRKTRLKSATKGKSGGFRVDYIDIPEAETLHLIVIYAKNVKEDLSSDEKKILADLGRKLKKEAINGKNVRTTKRRS